MPPLAVSKLVEEDHNVQQSLDLNKLKIPELLISVEVSAPVSLSREQELINKNEGPGRENNQICKRSMGLRKAFTAAEWENNNNLGKEEGYYDSCTYTNASIEKKKETEERTHAVKSKFRETTVQEQGRDNYLSEEEIYYDA